MDTSTFSNHRIKKKTSSRRSGMFKILYYSKIAISKFWFHKHFKLSLVSGGRGKVFTWGKSCLTPWAHFIWEKRLPYTQSDFTTRCKCEICRINTRCQEEIKWTQTCNWLPPLFTYTPSLQLAFSAYDICFLAVSTTSLRICVRLILVWLRKTRNYLFLDTWNQYMMKTQALMVTKKKQSYFIITSVLFKYCFCILS